MRHIFSWYLMVPIIIIFSLFNGLFFNEVSPTILFIGVVIIGLGSVFVTVIYGSFIQGDSTMYEKGSKWIGITVYTLLLIPSIGLLWSTYHNSNILDQTILNLRFISINAIFAFTYGIAGIVWSYFSMKSFRISKQLREPGAIGITCSDKVIQIDNFEI